MNTLRASSTTLRSLNIEFQPCNWASLSDVKFTELRSLQLTLSNPRRPSDCRHANLAEANILLSSTIPIPRFLKSMQHLTNLVLSLHHPSSEITRMAKAYFPALVALDIYTDPNAYSPALNLFIANHPGLRRLHLTSVLSFISQPFQTQHFPELRALKFMVEEANYANGNGLFPFFAPPDLGSAETIRARRPRIEHLSIYNLRNIQPISKYTHPYVNQLRRLDLQILDSGQISQEDLITTLGPFTALVEISVILDGIHERPGFGRRAIEKSIKELQNYLTSLKNCVPLRAIHLYNPSSQPLSSSDLQNLQPVPPALQYVSWGNRFGTTIFRVIHDSASQSAHVEVCEIPPPPREMVYDWTSENTFRHVLNL
ncbi:hypothetical protein SCHPADRAFT_561987 [Schizopora paradoxa]|uniref:F-box domain-containing protein n=1 Tax=Schizopora paradoxa TaxID=27342 RepID=A0A0H2RJA9_9AGAM|nr:hypothetical protein SCHPADRAFT_561987 [Schizopora paradoxa]